MNLNLVKILKIIGFSIVTFISTWATVESIYRLISWPKYYIWPLSILFFITAAYGVSLMIKSFDYSNRVHDRLKILLFGLFLFVVFWLGLILPTNTHTFFYKRVIKETAIFDIQEARTTLENLSTRGSNLIEEEKNNFAVKVNSQIANLQHEIKDINNSGYGSKADKILIDLENILGSNIQRLTIPRVRSERNLQIFSQNMAEVVRDILAIKLREYDEKKALFEKGIERDELNTIISNLKKASIDIKSLDEPSDEIKTNLDESYAKIKSYSDKLNESFRNVNLEKITKTPKSIQIENVFETWKNFFRGDYAGKGFIYFILGAALIDLLGFILYHLAFKKENN